MKKTLLVIGMVFVLLASVFLLSSISELKAHSAHVFKADITTDRTSYVQSDIIAFDIHLLESDSLTGAVRETNETFTLTIAKDYPYALLTTKTGKSPMTFSYPASSLVIGRSNLFNFHFSGIPDSRSFTDGMSVSVTQFREADIVPPTLVLHGMTGGSIWQEAEVCFSEPVKPLTSSNFFIMGVTGTILQTGNYAILTPTNLDYNTQYTVHLSAVQDLAGNFMTDFSWNFNVGRDGTLPEVKIVYPIAILEQGYDLRQADVYDVNFGSMLPNTGVAYNNVLTMTGTATDISGISSVTSYNEANGQTTAGTGGSSWTVSVTLVPDNNHNIITVTAEDPSGNAGTDKILVHYSTGGVQVIDVHFTEPASIGADGNGQFVTDGRTVNVSGTASYTYRNLIGVYWHNNLTDERGTAWSGGSHSVDWDFTANLVYGENPVWVEVKEESGFSTYRAFIAICNYMTLEVDADPDVVQLFSQVSFSSAIDGGAPAFSYQWNFGDGASSTDANPTHIFATTGTFDVTLTVTDSRSNVRNGIVSVTVTTTLPPLPPQPPLDGRQWFIDYGLIIGIIAAIIGAALAFIPVSPKPVKKVGYIIILAAGAILGTWVLITSITPIG
jgi:hypothetical protein